MNRSAIDPNEPFVDPPRLATHYVSDVRVDAIKQALDRLTQLGVPTLTARQSLDSLARDVRRQRPARDD